MVVFAEGRSLQPKKKKKERERERERGGVGAMWRCDSCRVEEVSPTG